MTLDGTRTYVIGRARTVVIDPGPDDVAHIDAIAAEVRDGTVACILLTHLHPDHAAGADRLAAQLDTGIRAIGRGTLSDGDGIETDAGAFIALHTPGHTSDHAAFHWPAGNAVFCGDLMMGGLETALVAAPEGDLGHYLGSLDRLRALEPEVIHPAHGPSFDRPAEALRTYVLHREARLRQVLGALDAVGQTVDEIAEAVYGGTIPDALRAVARDATLAYLEHLSRAGQVRSASGRWALRPTEIVAGNEPERAAGPSTMFPTP